MADNKVTFSSWLKVHVAEFKRIIWPSKAEIARETVSVIVVSLLFGVIIIGFDFIVSTAYNALMTLVG